MKYRSKKHKVLRAGIVTAAAAAAALILTGCLFSPPEPKEEKPAPEMTTPAYVLENIAYAYNHKDIDRYKKALSPSFVFYFDPRDVGKNPPGSSYVIPESWSYTEDWQVTEKMFQHAYSISLSIPTGRVGEPEPEENEYQADNISISLLLMIDELNGYGADQGYCNFKFEKYQNEQSEDRWRLIAWWDRTAIIPS
ncbi:MAG: hypothetical protein V3T41_06060 [bacterium]